MAIPAIQLSPEQYEVAWIAPRTLEFRAAICMLDHDHEDLEIQQGQRFIYHPGDIAGVNTIVATLGSKYGQLLSSNLAEEIKRIFTNVRIYLLVGIAAGIPTADRDIRLGDVLLAIGDTSHPAIVSYDRGTLRDGDLQLQHHGYTTFQTANIVVQALERVQLKWQLGKRSFMENYALIKDNPTRLGQSGYPKTFQDPGQSYDRLYVTTDSGQVAEKIVGRDLRDEKERTQVWTGTIGSGNILMRDARRRNELQQNFDLIGIEMEAVGVLEHLDAGVIRAVSDYADNKKNNDFHPYAAAMAASFAREVVLQFRRASAENNAIARASRPELHAEAAAASSTAHDVDSNKIDESETRASNFKFEHTRLEPAPAFSTPLSNSPIPRSQSPPGSRISRGSCDQSQYFEQKVDENLLLDHRFGKDDISSLLQEMRAKYRESRFVQSSSRLAASRTAWEQITVNLTLLVSKSPTYFGHLTSRAVEAYCEIWDNFLEDESEVKGCDSALKALSFSSPNKMVYLFDLVITLYFPTHFVGSGVSSLSDIIRIWTRFRSPSDGASKSEILAILYMIHLEGDRRFRTKRPFCSKDDRYELTPSDLHKITCFPRWVTCLCTVYSGKTSRWSSPHGCGTEWNFMNNKYGMFRDKKFVNDKYGMFAGNKRDCIVVVRSREKQKQLESGSREPYISQIRDPEDSTAADEALEAIRTDWIQG